MERTVYEPMPITIVCEDDIVGYEGRHYVTPIRVNEVDDKGAHIHSFCEIYVNVSGNVSFMVENNVYPVSSGDIVISRPNEVHHCIYHEDCVHEHYCIWISAAGELMKDMTTVFFDRTAGEGNLISMSDEDKAKLFEYLKVFCVENDAVIRRDAATLSAFFGILGLVEQNKAKTIPARQHPELMRDILLYIEKHFTGSCKVEEVAEAFFISRSALGGMFKKYMNLSPSKYIEAKRFSYAKSLLAKGENVQKVCDACGFSDCSYFISAFKKRFSITPYQYLKNNKI